LQTIGKANTGAMRHGVAVAALAAAVFFVVDATGSAQAQFFPWGGWDNSAPWQQQRRVPRRSIPPNVEDDGEKIVSTLPKPTGPLTIVVSLGKQTVSIYDHNQKIASSPISSGMSGRETPTGIFSIIEKNRYHYSNLYGGAPMPYMNRITNSGVAMHEGVVPGYPASHGCIRLPAAFARNLFGITEIGARVIVTYDDPTPADFQSEHIIEPLPPATADATKAGYSPVTPAAAEGVSAIRTREQAAAERAVEREHLTAAVTAAEATKTAAIDKAKAAAEAARVAKDEARKARNEQDRLADEARKAARTAENARDSFADLMRTKAKIDVATLDAEALKKEQDGEVAEETKVLDLADAVAPAKALVEKQAEVAKKAAADADVAEKARRAAVDEIKGTEKAIVDAKAAIVASNAIEAKKDNPVSIFVSRKTGRLSAKLGMGDPVIDVPVKITNPNAPIGTHVFTATAYTPGEKALNWSVVTFNAAAAPAPQKIWRKRRHEDQDYVAAAGENADPANAVARIEIPKETAERLAELVKPGSTLIISDYGLSRETSKRSDFIVEPWRSSTAAPAEYEGGRVE
jgi:lipoprotein-anchoring transpeptidase ErfK/SrfK